MIIMKILEYPNPILEQKATAVKIPLIESDLNLIKEMWQTVQGIGVGLAAPQVGVSKQIFIVRLGEDKEIRKKLQIADFVVLNPKITFFSNHTVELIEGCLSFPDEYWRIKRPENIVLEYETISNFEKFIKGEKPRYKKLKLHAKGWLSRVIQHETDHLLGEIFIKKGGKKITKKDMEDLEDDIID
jgi:peptide deformylase